MDRNAIVRDERAGEKSRKEKGNDDNEKERRKDGKDKRQDIDNVRGE